jgi:hypothetical protein
MGRVLRAGVLFGVILAATSAGAQSNSAMAESLFREGKKLLELRRFDEACPKFKESANLDPSSGVELALGLCYEGQGKTASAWGAYVTAASLARRDNRHDREQAANKHAEALEPKLAHITIEVAPETAALAGLQVKQDGIVVGSEVWKSAPADPGSHTLEVAATGKKPFTLTFLVDPSSHATAKVPALEAAPQLPGTVVVAPPPPPPPPSHVGRNSGFVIGGVGVALVATGAVLGLIAIEDASTAHTDCPSSPCGNAQGVSKNNTAGTFADWSTGLVIAGGAAVVGGLALVLFTGRSKEAPASRGAEVTPMVGPGYAGVTGRF